MSTTELPPLPKPDTHCFDEDTGKDVWSHSPEQMQAYAIAAIEAQGVPDGWQPIETAPESMDECVVVGWLDDEGLPRTEFDYKEDGCWIKWHEHAEHTEVIGGHGVSYTPPYTRWLKLPPLAAAPQPVAQTEQPAVLGEPLFLLHTGDDFGGERGDWDVEANSFRVVEEFCKKHPPNTAIGLFAHPQPERVALDGIESALESLVNRCNNDAGMTNDPEVVAAEAALERLYKSRTTNGIKGAEQ